MTPNGETPCTDCNGSGINGQTGQWCTCDVGVGVAERPKAPPQPTELEVRFSEEALNKARANHSGHNNFFVVLADILATDATTQLRAAEKAAYERGLAEVRDSLKELAEKYTGDPTGFAVAVYGRHGHAGKITDEDLAWAEEAIARMEAKKASPLSDAPAPAPKRRVVQIIPQTQYALMMAFCDDDTLLVYTTDGWKQLPPIPQPGDTP